MIPPFSSTAGIVLAYCNQGVWFTSRVTNRDFASNACIMAHYKNGLRPMALPTQSNNANHRGNVPFQNKAGIDEKSIQ